MREAAQSRTALRVPPRCDGEKEGIPRTASGEERVAHQRRVRGRSFEMRQIA